MQSLTVKVTKAIPKSHVHCSIFMNKALNGKLIFTIDEYKVFRLVMSRGCMYSNADVELSLEDNKFLDLFPGG